MPIHSFDQLLSLILLLTSPEVPLSLQTYGDEWASQLLPQCCFKTFELGVCLSSTFEFQLTLHCRAYCHVRDGDHRSKTACLHSCLLCTDYKPTCVANHCHAVVYIYVGNWKDGLPSKVMLPLQSWQSLQFVRIQTLSLWLLSICKATWCFMIVMDCYIKCTLALFV